MLVVQAGYGRFGMVVATLIDRVDGARLVGVCDPGGVDHRVGSENLMGVLDVMRPDVLVVAVPPAVQVEVCELAAAMRVPRVRVEKPCGVSVDDAVKIGSLPMDVRVGYTTLYLDGFRWLREHVFADDPVVMVRATRLSVEGARHESALLDMGSHAAAMSVAVGCDSLRLDVGTGAGSVRETIFELESGRWMRMVEDASGQTVHLSCKRHRRFDQAHPLLADLEASLKGEGPDAAFAVRVHELLQSATVEDRDWAVSA